MKTKLIALIGVIAMVTGMAVFLNQRQQSAKATTTSAKIRVVSTNSILDDMVKNVGGQYVQNYSIVKRGTDPHEYEPRPTDIAATAEADVIFYNGTAPTGLPACCTPIAVGGKSQQGITGETSGNLTWSDSDPRIWYPDGRQYYYPIPASAILKNSNLKQNPGW